MRTVATCQGFFIRAKALPFALISAHSVVGIRFLNVLLYTIKEFPKQCVRLSYTYNLHSLENEVGSDDPRKLHCNSQKILELYQRNAATSKPEQTVLMMRYLGIKKGETKNNYIINLPSL